MAAQHHVRPDRWLAFARRGRSTWALGRLSWSGDVNEAYTLTQQQEVTFRLNQRLARVTADITLQLESRWKDLNAVDHFFITQFGKAQRTFLAIHTLLRESLIEDALCLLRVLVENTINLKYGVHSNPVQVVRRYWDWAMLDSVRRARAANWFEGTSLHSEERKAALLKGEAEVRSRYSAEEFESLKRNVFGLSLEKRAEVAKLSQLYDASYRVLSLLSRNVHAMDVAVMDVTRATSSAGEHTEFLRVRTSHLLDIAQWCLGTITIWANGQFLCGYDEVLETLQGHS